jgi:hypothetical protein
MGVVKGLWTRSHLESESKIEPDERAGMAFILEGGGRESTIWPMAVISCAKV